MPFQLQIRCSRTQRRLLTLVASGCFVAVGCSQDARKSQSLPDLFGGKEGLEVVKNPTKVEAYRLAEIPYESIDEHTQPWDFATVGEPIAVPMAMAKDVSAALTSRESFDWSDTAKACGWPVYGVRLDFLRDGRRVEAYLCFSCFDVAVVEQNRRVGTGDFSPANVGFVRIAKEIFPDDAVIQGLNE